MKLFIPTVCPLCSRTLQRQKEEPIVWDCYNPEGDCFWGCIVDVKSEEAESFVSVVSRRNPRVLFIFFEDYFRINIGFSQGTGIPYGKMEEIDFSSKEALHKIFAYGQKLLLL